MRLSRQFQACLFFSRKIFWAYKNVNQPKPTNKSKNSRTKKKQRQRYFACTKTSKGVKIVCRVLVLFVRAKYFRKKTKQTRNCLDNLNSLYYFVILTYKTKHCVGFFAQTCKTKQTTNKSLLLRARKKVSISISFQT